MELWNYESLTCTNRFKTFDIIKKFNSFKKTLEKNASYQIVCTYTQFKFRWELPPLLKKGIGLWNGDNLGKEGVCECMCAAKPSFGHPCIFPSSPNSISSENDICTQRCSNFNIWRRKNRKQKRTGKNAETKKQPNTWKQSLEVPGSIPRADLCKEILIFWEVKKTTPVGFEPTRGDPIGLAGRRLNRSAKVSLELAVRA